MFYEVGLESVGHRKKPVKNNAYTATCNKTTATIHKKSRSLELYCYTQNWEKDNYYIRVINIIYNNLILKSTN